MDWLDPFCLLCGSHATLDHIAAPKHIDKAKKATEWTRSRGYGEVVDWIEKDVQEVINVANSSPTTKTEDEPREQRRRRPSPVRQGAYRQNLPNDSLRRVAVRTPGSGPVDQEKP